MIIHDLATTLELFTILLCAYTILGRFDQTRWRYLGIVFFIGQIVVTHFTILDIPVWGQLLICFLWIAYFYIRHDWKQMAYAAVVSYGGALLFLQAFVLLQISDYLRFNTPHLFALVMNLIVFLLMLLVYYSFRAVRRKYPSIESNKGLRITLVVSSFAMMVVCQHFRVEVMQTYRMESQWVSLVLVLSLLVGAFWVIRGAAVKMRAQEKAQHDYDKRIQYLEEAVQKQSGAVRKFEADEETASVLQTAEPSLQHVLHYYLSYCAQRDITLRLKASAVMFETGLTEKEALTVFGNLLENAARAVQELDAPERWIEWNMEWENQTITVTNPAARQKAGTKRPGHGYGQEIVGETLQKCGAQISYEQGEDRYTVVLKWPVKI